MRFGSLFSRQTTIDEENPYWISFSDIMSGLLVIFVLAVLALVLELTETKIDVTDAIRDLVKAESVRRNILREIKDELAKKNINVEITDNETVIRIPENILAFEKNEYRIPPKAEMRETTLEIGYVLYETITKNNRWEQLDTIFVEGHTDRRASPRRMGNWGLSTFRAISVWNYWNEKIPDSLHLHDLTNHKGDPLFSVSGYAETRPIEIIQETEEEFKKNRRIDIRFTVRRPALEEYENIRKLLGD